MRRGEDEYVRRVTGDGAVWVHSHLPRGGSDGWPTETGEPCWRSEATLPPPALDALRDAIAASGFFELAPEHHPDAAVIGATEEVWSVDLDGRSHSVRLLGVPETEVAAVTELSEALEDALAAAEEAE